GVDGERTHAEMRLVEHARLVAHHELVPQGERGTGDVEARADVRAGRRRPDGDRHRSTDAGSFNPWPVTTQTTSSPARAEPCARPAMPAADADSLKTPSSVRSSFHAARSSSSVTVTTSPPERAITSPTCARCTGSTIRIAEPNVVGRSPDSTGTRRGSAPAARSKPSAYARVLPPPPYGSVRTSGSPPSSSTISTAALD